MYLGHTNEDFRFTMDVLCFIVFSRTSNLMNSEKYMTDTTWVTGISVSIV